MTPTATDEKTVLEVYEGLDVIEAGIEIPNIGGGFHDTQKIDPRILHHGDSGHIVLHYVTKKVRYDPIDKDEPMGDQRRVHVLSVDAAAYSDDPKVVKIIDGHRAAVKRRQDALSGQGSFDKDAAGAAQPE